MNSITEMLNRWSAALPGLAWQMFWQSSLLIAAVFVLDFALRRKVHAAARHALWLVVILKLVVPPTFALPTGLAWWLRSTTTPPPIAASGKMVVTYEHNPILVAPQPAGPVVAPPAPRLSVAAWMFVGSSLVSSLLLGWLLVRWIQVSRNIRRAREAGETLGPILGEARSLIGLGRPVRLRVTPQEMSPAVCGLFRPVILLPEKIAATLSASQLRAVLVHELTHVKRGDVWVNCLQTLVQIVYWWHPLVWLANARIRHVREEAVDDAVMLALRDEADCYAPTLLEVAKLAFHRPLASLGLVGILESRSALRQRIERLIDFQMPRRAGVSFVSLLGIAAFTAVAVPMGEAPQLAQNNSPIAVPLTQEVAPTNLPVRVMTAMRTNLIHTSPARQAIVDKLKQIRFDSVSYDGLPLPEVIRKLSEEIKQRDPEKRGVNIVINAMQAAQPVAVNPATGLLATLPAAPANDETDINAVRVTIHPPLTNPQLTDVLDAIVKAADKPIKYSILDFGIVFSPKGNESPPLSSRRFKVDPNTFLRGLQSVSGFDSATPQQNSSAVILPRVSVEKKSGGSQLVTANATNALSLVQSSVIAYFRTIGVNLDPPKSVFFGDREGTLWVRATTEDLAVIEKAIQILNTAPPQVHIHVKFVEVPKAVADAFWETHPYTNSFTRMAGDAPLSHAVLASAQTKIFLQSLKNQKGVKELSDGQVTTLSGRQTQLQNVDHKTLVIGMTNGAPVTTNKLFGSTMDVVPTVSADGYTIQMKLTPTVTEFLGYEEPSKASTYLRVPGKNGAPPEIFPLPSPSDSAIPRFRQREMTINTAILDGQTLVLGHFRPEDWFGQERQSVIRYLQEDPQRNLLVLVTPTLLDPAGNRVHVDDDIPVIKK